MKMVVRRAEIDKGPLRQSHCTVLHWDQGDRGAGNGSGQQERQPWVEVRQHGIRYTFDITRVMFSAGNTTERRRMGRLDTEGETVVDMYTGIGYFTLPLLVQGRVAHLHACELNPDSIAALRRNLSLNGVSPHRFTIHEGDNLVAASRLRCTADRVCLGLLPTATRSHSAAVALLRSTGGWLHVHANVHERERTQWATALAAELSAAAREQGRNWKATVRHVERVKSYAPRVDHLVADVKLEPVKA